MEENQSQGLELSLEEFGDVPVGVPVGNPSSHDVLPAYLKTVPVRDTNAYLLVLAIASELLDGVPIQLACMLAGTDFDEISKLAEEHDAIQRNLNFAYASGLKNQYLEKIKKGDPKTAMEILGRMVPSLFGESRSSGGTQSQSLSLMGSALSRKVNKNIDYKNMTDEELAKLAGELNE